MVAKIDQLILDDMLDSIPFEVYAIDVEKYEILYANQAIQETHGEVLGKTCYRVLYEEENPCIHCRVKELVDEEMNIHSSLTTYEYYNEGHEKWYHGTDKIKTLSDGTIVKYSIGIDISELKETQNDLASAHAQLAIKNKELELLSTTDQLTKLHNRLHLDNVMGKEIYAARRYRHPLSFIIIDVDKFKSVNDTYGHQVGDSVLKDVAKIIKQNVRQSDIAGRWGGEEFVVICPNTDLNGGKILAEKLRKALEAHTFDTVGRKTASFGVSLFREEDDDKDFVGRADEALYVAKETGRNKVCTEKPAE